MFDYLQIIFWSITYLLVIIAGIKGWGSKRISIPYLAVTLNLSWEICAIVVSGGYWGHIAWLGLDCIILFLGFSFLEKKSQKVRFLMKIVVFTIVLSAFFIPVNGMLLSSFAIDLIMAISFFINRKGLSPILKIPIAVTKLLGDVFAWIYYGPNNAIIMVIGIIVFMFNVYYLFYCIDEKLRNSRKSRMKNQKSYWKKKLVKRE